MKAVFIVENEAPLMKLLGWALIEEGLKVSRSTHMQEALIRLADGETSCVIVNATLPAGELETYIEDVRRAAPAARVIALVASAESGASVNADAYVKQPWRIDEIVNLVDATA